MKHVQEVKRANNTQNTTHDQDTPRGMLTAACTHRASPAVTATQCEDHATAQQKTSPRTHSHKPTSDITTRNEPQSHIIPQTNPPSHRATRQQSSTVSCHQSSHRFPRNGRASYDTRVAPSRPHLSRAHIGDAHDHTDKTRNAPKWDNIHEN